MTTRTIFPQCKFLQHFPSQNYKIFLFENYFVVYHVSTNGNRFIELIAFPFLSSSQIRLNHFPEISLNSTEYDFTIYNKSKNKIDSNKKFRYIFEYFHSIHIYACIYRNVQARFNIK